MECIDPEVSNWIMISLCITSIISSIFVIVLCIIPDLIEKLSGRLLILFSFNNLCRSLLFILGLFSTGYFCLIVGFLKNIFLMSNVLWSLFIVRRIVQCTIKKEDISPNKFYYWFLFSYIGIPALESLAFITNSFDNTICDGIKQDLTGVIWRITIVYTPSLLATGWILWLYYKILKFIKLKININAIEFSIERGLLYSLQFVIIFIPLPFLRILSVYSDSAIVECFIFAEAALINFQGTILLILTLLRTSIKLWICCKSSDLLRFESEGEYISSIIN